MHPLHPAFALIIFLISFSTAYLIKLRYKLLYTTSRYESIDSLRGFLAIGVFIHHSTIWYTYIQTGNWQAPESNLYNQLGQTSVSFFFMITSFLFVTKLLNTKGFNWHHFYISRVFRLLPLYYVSLLIIILYVMILSDWHLKVELHKLVGHLFNWSILTLTKASDINSCKLTQVINAKVVWSLPFEWLFYFSLPLISLFLPIKIRVFKIYYIISLYFVLYYFTTHEVPIHNLLSFVGGSIAPFLIKFTSCKHKATNPIFSLLIVVCFAIILSFREANKYCQVAITIIFTIVVLGNTFFGLFKSSTLKFLGEISYSTYLLHGIILFSVIYFGLGIETTRHLSTIEYCTLIFLATPIVIVVSFLGFRFIENPFINIGKKIIQ